MLDAWDVAQDDEQYDEYGAYKKEGDMPLSRHEFAVTLVEMEPLLTIRHACRMVHRREGVLGAHGVVGPQGVDGRLQ